MLLQLTARLQRRNPTTSQEKFKSVRFDSLITIKHSLVAILLPARKNSNPSSEVPDYSIQELEESQSYYQLGKIQIFIDERRPVLTIERRNPTTSQEKFKFRSFFFKQPPPFVFCRNPTTSQEKFKLSARVTDVNFTQVKCRNPTTSQEKFKSK